STPQEACADTLAVMNRIPKTKPNRNRAEIFLVIMAAPLAQVCAYFVKNSNGKRLQNSRNTLAHLCYHTHPEHTLQSSRGFGLSVQRQRWQHVLLFVALLCGLGSFAGSQNTPTATLTIDANKAENPISPTLYGQFMEFMFEDIKGGLYAELIRDRGFDEQ